MMLLTSKEIVDLLSQPVTGINIGRARNKISRCQSRSGGDLLSTAQLETMRAYTEASDHDAVATRQIYRHPGEGTFPGSRRGDGPLTPSELAWLDRMFPTSRDPASIPFEEAQALAALAGSVSRMKQPDDERLVSAVWQPIKRHHDEQQALVDLHNARLPQPPIPSHTLTALADAIAGEQPDLPADVAVSRARVLLEQITNRREQDRAKRIAIAEERQMGIDAKAYDRVAS